MDIAGGESRDDGRTVHMEAAVKQRVRFSDTRSFARKFRGHDKMGPDHSKPCM